MFNAKRISISYLMNWILKTYLDRFNWIYSSNLLIKLFFSFSIRCTKSIRRWSIINRTWSISFSTFIKSLSWRSIWNLRKQSIHLVFIIPDNRDKFKNFVLHKSQWSFNISLSFNWCLSTHIWQITSSQCEHTNRLVFNEHDAHLAIIDNGLWFVVILKRFSSENKKKRTKQKSFINKNKQNEKDE